MKPRLLASFFRGLFRTIIGLIAGIFSGAASSAEIRVAVASNFSDTFLDISQRFELQSKHHIKIIRGSTGKIYTQITQRAPYDLFLAADSRHPALIENASQIKQTKQTRRFTYAIGKIALWGCSDPTLKREQPTNNAALRLHSSRKREMTKVASLKYFLQHHKFKRLAVANPRLAPYGKASIQILDSLGLDDIKNHRLVIGENIAQAFQYVSTGNAELGLVALSQLQRYKKPVTENLDKSIQATTTETAQPLCFSNSFSNNRKTLPKNNKRRCQLCWVIPQKLYRPIIQQGIILKYSEGISDLVNFMGSSDIRQLIKSHGYDLP